MVGAGGTRSRGGLQVFTLEFPIKDWGFQAQDNKLDSAIGSLSLAFARLGAGRLEPPNPARNVVMSDSSDIRCPILLTSSGLGGNRRGPRSLFCTTWRKSTVGPIRAPLSAKRSERKDRDSLKWRMPLWRGSLIVCSLLRSP